MRVISVEDYNAAVDALCSRNLAALQLFAIDELTSLLQPFIFEADPYEDKSSMSSDVDKI